MTKKLNSVFVLVLIILHSSCIKKVQVPIRNVEPILVVEGLITNDSVPYQVKLSYSGSYTFGNQIPTELYEANALVSISDSEGAGTPLFYREKGLYETNDKNFIGTPGKGYTLHIKLPNGKEYISEEQVIPEPVPIQEVSSIQHEFTYDLKRPTRFNIFITSADPADQENYYRWVSDGWVPRKATGVPCGFFCIEFEFCHQHISESSVRIFSDNAINGNKIINQLVGSSYLYYFGRHYIRISQLSMTRSSYQFWNSFQLQLESSGGLLDAIPSSINSGIYNVNNPADRALGIFEASAVAHYRFILVPENVSNFLLQQTALPFIETGACHLIYENAIEIPPPPGWEAAPEIRVVL